MTNFTCRHKVTKGTRKGEVCGGIMIARLSVDSGGCSCCADPLNIGYHCSQCLRTTSWDKLPSDWPRNQDALEEFLNRAIRNIAVD